MAASGEIQWPPAGKSDVRLRGDPDGRRQENHHDAETLVITITPGGKRAASHLRQLIEIKDTAHYGFITVTAPTLKRSLRQARQLVDFAEGVVRRTHAG